MNVDVDNARCRPTGLTSVCMKDTEVNDAPIGLVMVGYRVHRRRRTGLPPVDFAAEVLIQPLIPPGVACGRCAAGQRHGALSRTGGWSGGARGAPDHAGAPELR